MNIRPSRRGRQSLTGRAPRTMRYALYAALAAGAASVIHFGASLAILAGSPGEGPPVATHRASGGALVICGGGRLPEQVRDRFLELAGGRDARIVVIPTAHTDADGPNAARSLEPWKKRQIASLRLFHTRSRVEADDLEFTRPLAEATGVWIGGGLQAKLTQAYLGTDVERQLKALLARGGVIGGTSAGAAVMSRVMITSGRTEAMLGEGFGLLPGTVIDQHFMKRNRMERLLGVVRQHPDLVGLGIDEQTAIVVDLGSRRISVLGNSYVVACVPEPPQPTSEPVMKPGDLASARVAASTTPHVEFLKPGDEADLTALKTHPDNAVVQRIDFEAL